MKMTTVRTAVTVLGLLLLAAAGSGCRGVQVDGHDLTFRETPEPFVPDNLQQLTPWLPPALRRVAILPLTATDQDLAPETRAQLEQLLPIELNRTEQFEVVQVTPGQLRRWTGRSRWGVTDSLPADLLKRIQSQLECDAVVFAHLTAYRPYPPLVMGWKLHLVDAREGQVWWASDVIYDAGDERVAHSAVQYEREFQTGRLPTADPATILRSPGRFGQYTLATSLGTLQRHEKNH